MEIRAADDGETASLRGETRLDLISVLVIEEAPLIRGAILGLLCIDDRFFVQATPYDGAAVLADPARPEVDVVVLDIAGEDVDITLRIQRLLEVDVHVRPLVYSSVRDAQRVDAAFRAGARGFISRTSPTKHLIDAIVEVAHGRQVVSRSLTSISPTTPAPRRTHPDHELSAADLMVLQLVADGATDAEIARRLFVSTRTVQNMLSRLRRITQARGRVELALWSVEHGVST
jgi:DNA-binding NarL/FixJ family response regulator